MLSWFKKYFIPHGENGHRPHILRKENLAFILIIILIVEFVFLVAAFIYTKTEFFAAILPNVLVDATNGERQKLELNNLRISQLLEEAAQLKANDMAQKGYFAHTSPEGITPWFWVEKTGYKYSYAGENLGVNFIDSKALHNAWVNSPKHYENIINKNYTEIGIATSKGIYKGSEAIFVVEFFGRPLSLNQTIITASPKPTPKIISQNTQSQKNSQENSIVLSEVKESAPNTEKTANSPIQYSSLEERTLATPKTWINWFFEIAAISIMLSIALIIFVKIESSTLKINLISSQLVRKRANGRKVMIFNGLTIVLAILLIIWFNVSITGINALILVN